MRLGNRDSGRVIVTPTLEKHARILRHLPELGLLLLLILHLIIVLLGTLGMHRGILGVVVVRAGYVAHTLRQMVRGKRTLHVGLGVHV